MITAHDLLWGIVYPLVFAIVAMIVGRFAQRGPRGAAAWAITVAIVGGFAIAFVGISGGLAFPPKQAQEWLPWMGGAVVIVSIVATFGRLRWIVWVLSIAILAATAYLVANRRQHALGAHEFGTLVCVAAGAMVVWWMAMEGLASRSRGVTLPLLLSGVAGGCALVLINGGTQRLGQIEGGLAVVLLVMAALSFWLFDLSLSRGGMLALSITMLGMLLCGYLYADVKWIEAALLAIAPVMAWAGELPIVRTRKPWLRFAICAILVLGVASIAVIPAAKGLRQTMKEQAESYQY